MAIFKSLRQRFLQYMNSPMSAKVFWRHLGIIVAAAVLLRIVLALPALRDASALLRPDSMGYWNPACAIAAGDGLVSEPGSTQLEVVRPVGYPALLALVIVLCGKSFAAAAVAGVLVSASGVVPVMLAVRRFFGERAGVLAGWLWALNLTGIAASVLILSDTLLSVLAAWQFYFAVRFVKEKKLLFFAPLTLSAILAVLVKPVNLPIVLAGLPLILLIARLPRQDLLRGALIWVILFCGLLLPYWVRNAAICGDLDGNTANLYFHNGSAVMARVTGESSEVWRERLLAQAEREFAAHPEQYPTIKEQNRWKKAQFSSMIKAHPQEFAITHLPNIFNLLPDVPSMLENNHVTQSGRGTMAVLRQKGFFAAVNHYFNGKWQVMLYLLPLLGIYLLTLLLALIQVVKYLKKIDWQAILLFGTLVFYYVWAPGPVISPRYLLPALPMMIFMAVQCCMCNNKGKTFNNKEVDL